MKLINDKFNGVKIWQRDDGLFGVEVDGEDAICWRYKTEYLANKIAQALSDENNISDGITKEA